VTTTTTATTTTTVLLVTVGDGDLSFTVALKRWIEASSSSSSLSRVHLVATTVLKTKDELARTYPNSSRAEAVDVLLRAGNAGNDGGGGDGHDDEKNDADVVVTTAASVLYGVDATQLHREKNCSCEGSEQGKRTLLDVLVAAASASADAAAGSDDDDDDSPSPPPSIRVMILFLHPHLGYNSNAKCDNNDGVDGGGSSAQQQGQRQRQRQRQHHESRHACLLAHYFDSASRLIRRFDDAVRATRRRCYRIHVCLAGDQGRKWQLESTRAVARVDVRAGILPPRTAGASAAADRTRHEAVPLAVFVVRFALRDAGVASETTGTRATAATS